MLSGVPSLTRQQAHQTHATPFPADQSHATVALQLWHQLTSHQMGSSSCRRLKACLLSSKGLAIRKSTVAAGLDEPPLVGRAPVDSPVVQQAEPAFVCDSEETAAEAAAPQAAAAGHTSKHATQNTQSEAETGSRAAAKREDLPGHVSQ